VPFETASFKLFLLELVKMIVGPSGGLSSARSSLYSPLRAYVFFFSVSLFLGDMGFFGRRIW